MKVSLITVTLNSERFLEECILSVVNQDHKDIEYIVIDGGSTDGTRAIIEKYSDFITRWISVKDDGMYDAINTGMREATGEIIGTLNSDDILASTDVISSIAACFTEKPDVDALYGDLVYVDQKDTDKVTRVWKGLPFKRSRFRHGWMPAHPTFYFRRNLLNKFGFYESHFYSASDYEFMLRYLYYYSVNAVYLARLLVKMRVGGMSNRTIYQRLRANRRDYLAMRRNRVPFPLLVALIKPMRKLHQFNPWAEGQRLKALNKK